MPIKKIDEGYVFVYIDNIVDAMFGERLDEYTIVKLLNDSEYWRNEAAGLRGCVEIALKNLRVGDTRGAITLLDEISKRR